MPKEPVRPPQTQVEVEVEVEVGTPDDALTYTEQSNWSAISWSRPSFSLPCDARSTVGH